MTLYNSNNIFIEPLDDNLSFLFSDHNEEIYGKYCYTDLLSFFEDTQHIDPQTMEEILEVLDKYYDK